MVTRVLGQIVRGFLMGASDVVPGVSGGTVALILGIYSDLITAVSTGSKALGKLAKGDFTGFVDGLKAVDWLFLIPLLVGLFSAILLLSGIIEAALRDHPETMAGLFFGLVLGSIVVARGLLEDASAKHAGIILAVAVVLFVLLGFQSGPVADPSALVLIGSGALAVCALILPGISGSFILLMIGMYAAVLNAVDERIISDIALVGLGAIVGLALFSSLLNHLLDNHHDTVMAVLIGLMFGSLRVLWPWPNGVGIIDHDEIISGTGLQMPNGAPWVGAVVFGAAAAIIVVAVSAFAQPKTETQAPESVHA